LENQKNQAKDQCIGGFNLLQISPNWFLGNWTLDPHLKWTNQHFLDIHSLIGYKKILDELWKI
jgi:hypothetical protein